LPLYQKWANDPEVTRTLEGPAAVTLEAAEARFQREVTSESDAHFTIYERATLRPIGATALHGIDQRHRRALFSIVIGETDCWGRGYGTEATRLMLHYAFDCLGLHHVRLGVHCFNERGIRAYARAGFKTVGVLREYHRLGGRAYDVILMDCLSTDLKPDVANGS
jgi:RimJ/RimL family protein N-acetyltransferase